MEPRVQRRHAPRKGSWRAALFTGSEAARQNPSQIVGTGSRTDAAGETATTTTRQRSAAAGGRIPA
jgi:hypothetical protein